MYIFFDLFDLIFFKYMILFLKQFTDKIISLIGK